MLCVHLKNNINFLAYCTLILKVLFTVALSLNKIDIHISDQIFCCYLLKYLEVHRFKCSQITTPVYFAVHLSLRNYH